MARPQKQTVNYFSHDTDASEKKTLTIIQNKYGNDGYAFWYKLLEILGKTNGHYYCFEDPADWEFLLAKTHIPVPEIAGNILETLATLDAIDKNLFHEHQVIWSQNFVDRLKGVYKKRDEPLPIKPDFNVSVGDNGVPVSDNPVTDSDNQQSKLNYIKVNNNIYILLFDHWNTLGIIIHSKLTSSIKSAVDSVIKDYSQDEIKQSMNNYAEIVKGKEYYFSYRWTLTEFLSRGKGNNIERFLDLERAKVNFKKEDGNGAHREKPRQLPTQYTKPEDL